MLNSKRKCVIHEIMLVYSPEDMTNNQKAQSFRRMVLAVPALMLSEFVLLSQEVIKLNQGNLLSHFKATLERTGSNEIDRLLSGTS